MPDLRGETELPVMHPRDAAGKIEAVADDIERGLALDRELARKGQVSPGPCGSTDQRRQVEGWDDPASNPNHESWYVGYSPFSVGKITYVEADRKSDVPIAMERLSGYLKQRGWSIVSFSKPVGGRWQLKVEAPEKGYGGIVEGPVANGRRITVTFSSPCFRHPDELPEG